MPTTVIRLQDMRSGDVYIGRAAPRRGLEASIWQNPFKLGKNGTLLQVMAQYRAYLQSRPALLARIPELRDKRLACGCTEERCHGDILAKLADAT